MKKIILIYIYCLFLMPVTAQLPVYLDNTKPIEDRVEDALSRLTLKEKINMLHAQSKFSSMGVARLGIPDNWTTDGPHGVKQETLFNQWYSAEWTNDSCTAFPALTCLAATWNPDMSMLYGKSIGEEARYRNKNILLGPGVNIYRTPLNGRNFEYMGEDPYLASQMVVPYIKGVQSNGVAACVKHFALNNQEEERERINVIVDDRALHEIYLPAFKAAVQQGNAWAIMGSYNKYRGQHCSHNQYLLNDILKGEWKYDGVVLSDWGGTHNTEQAANNGLDLEFGTWTEAMRLKNRNDYDAYYLSKEYMNGVKSGKYTMQGLNDKIRRILRLIFRTTMNINRPYGSFASQEHAIACRKIAQEGIVLLKNKKQLLPIDASKVKKILVVGENAVKSLTIGGGSSALKVKNEVSPLEGIKKRAGNEIEVTYCKGYKSPIEVDKYAKTLYNDKEDKRDNNQLIEEAVKASEKADLVIFIGGLNKNKFNDSEGADRKELGLPYNQDKLINELQQSNKNVVVVIISGNAVSMPWVNNVSSILEAWYNGSEAGNALASVLFGDVNPSGKLPFTFPACINDNAACAMNGYPGDKENVNYKESIYVGYRYTDKQKKTKPLFPFGYGLSYTNFEYGKAIADKYMKEGKTLKISIPIKNIGKCAGAEVVQLYISDEKSSLPRPIKELKGFKKVFLNPGESKIVDFIINEDALKFYDDIKKSWVAEPGYFKALIARSSAEIESTVRFELR